MTTLSLMTRSFILMKRAARFTGSSSVSAALKDLSYSSFRQRVMFVPCHLFSLVATFQEQNTSMKSAGSGCVCVVVYIWRSVEKCGKVSGLATSEEKNTDATTDFSSTLMPAFWH